jgi:hypothetical protein
MPELEAVHEVMGRRFLFTVETSDRGEDYLIYERMRMDIWEDPADHLAGARNLVSENFLFDGGSLFIAVYEEARAGGFTRPGLEVSRGNPSTWRLSPTGTWV